MNLKQNLWQEKIEARNGRRALLAWKILANLIGLAVIASIIAMIPEMRRYLKLKNM